MRMCELLCVYAEEWSPIHRTSFVRSVYADIDIQMCVIHVSVVRPSHTHLTTKNKTRLQSWVFHWIGFVLFSKDLLSKLDDSSLSQKWSFADNLSQLLRGKIPKKNMLKTFEPGMGNSILLTDFRSMNDLLHSFVYWLWYAILHCVHFADSNNSKKSIIIVWNIFLKILESANRLLTPQYITHNY